VDTNAKLMVSVPAYIHTRY